jgi:hypothetical protein
VCGEHGRQPVTHMLNAVAGSDCKVGGALGRGVLLDAPVARRLRRCSAVALKPVIACLGTGLTGGEASLHKGTTAWSSNPPKQRYLHHAGANQHGGTIECYGWLSSACESTVGTRLFMAVALGRWHCWSAVVSFAQNVRGLVCVPMLGTYRHLPGQDSALGSLALLECGGRYRTECALLSMCAYVWAHTGTRLVTAVPFGRWHCWSAAVGFA